VFKLAKHLLAKRLGMFVLAVWLVLHGAGALGVITLPSSLVGLLALIAGALILAGR
jgi:hypothetical protein